MFDLYLLFPRVNIVQGTIPPPLFDAQYLLSRKCIENNHRFRSTFRENSFAFSLVNPSKGQACIVDRAASARRPPAAGSLYGNTDLIAIATQGSTGAFKLCSQSVR